MRELRSYQTAVLEDIKTELKGDIPVVMAMCPNAGKTFTTIKLLEDLIDSGYAKKVLILAHATTVLRSQFYNSLEDNNPSFTYKQITPSNKSTNAQVLVAIPQGLSGVDLSKIDLVVVDEGHEWYLAPKSKELLMGIKPKNTLILTGTPSKFIYENHKNPNSYSIKLVAMSDIPSEFMANAQVFMCSSKYNIRDEDYNKDEEVLSKYKFKKDETEGTLDLFMDKMIKTLRMSHITKLDNYYPIAFGKLGKTMIACKSQSQAKQVYNYLTNKGVDTLISTESTDKESENINKFISEEDYKVLVVVNRGILGFNMPELQNVVDMTGTRNIDRMYQLFSRITRTYKNIKKKRYFKVAPVSEVEYMQYVTSAMLSLIHRDNIGIYNGKNFKTDLPILVKKSKTKSSSSKKKRKSTKAPILREFEGINVIDTFTKVFSNLDKEMQVYSRTDLYRVQLVMEMGARDYWDYKKCKSAAIEGNCKSKKELETYKSGASQWLSRNNLSDKLADELDWEGRTYWTYGKCKSAAIEGQCQSKKELETYKRGAYNWVRRNNLLYQLSTELSWGSRGRRIRCLTSPDGKFDGALYGSIKKAAETLNVPTSSIGDVCRGKYKQARGYTFEYVNEGEDNE